jgi:hypothetical protein
MKGLNADSSVTWLKQRLYSRSAMSIALAIKRPPARFGGAEMKLDGLRLLRFGPTEPRLVELCCGGYKHVIPNGVLRYRVSKTQSSVSNQ